MKNRNPLHKIEPLPGALCAQYMRCGKSNCKCAKGELHGPYFCHFVRQAGRLRKTYVKKADFETVSVACLAYRQQQRDIRELLREGRLMLRSMKWRLSDVLSQEG